MGLTREQFGRLIVGPLVLAAIPLVCIPWFEWATLTAQGNQSLLWMILPFALVAFVSLLVLAASLFALVFRKTRRYAAIAALWAIVYAAAFALAVNVGGKVRMAGFHRLAERSKPLIAAIHSYERKYEHPPESLQALVPEFIPAVPLTGMVHTLNTDT